MLKAWFKVVAREDSARSFGGNIVNTRVWDLCALAAATGALLVGFYVSGAAPAPANLPPPDNQKLAHDIYREIIEIHSVHDVGTKAVADALAARLKAGGFPDADI